MASQNIRREKESRSSSKDKMTSQSEESRFSPKTVNGRHGSSSSKQARSSKTVFNSSGQASTATNQCPGKHYAQSSSHSPHLTFSYGSHDNSKHYAATVTDGTASMGVRLPVHMQQALADRHGECAAWSVAEERVSDADVVGEMEFDGYVYMQEGQLLKYEYETRDNKGYFGEYLVGIGAQFESR